MIWEYWKVIPGTNGRYLVSNKGKIVHQLQKGDKMLKGHGKNYKTVKLNINNKRKDFYIHRLVAEAFCENPHNYPCVNHINGNKQDNRAENLEWCTYKHNIKEAFRLGLSYNKTGKGNGKSIAICQYDKNNNFIKKWESMHLAEKELNIRHISDCCKGKRKSAGNYIWKLALE